MHNKLLFTELLESRLEYRKKDTCSKDKNVKEDEWNKKYKM